MVSAHFLDGVVLAPLLQQIKKSSSLQLWRCLLAASCCHSPSVVCHLGSEQGRATVGLTVVLMVVGATLPYVSPAEMV